MLGRLGSAQVEVRKVRAELEAAHKLHGRYLSDLKVTRVLMKAGDAGVAADAICMWPRPQWVEAICGPYPASLELADPSSTASVEEWGHAGEGT